MASRNGTLTVTGVYVEGIVDRYLRMIDETTPAANGDTATLEDAFIRVAKCFSDQHGISYETWLDVGVHADVLSRARLGSQVTLVGDFDPALGIAVTFP